MHDRIEHVTRVVTSISLVACALLLAPGFAGLSPSLPLVVIALGLAVGGFTLRDQLRELTDTPWLRPHLETVWIGPLIAALVFVLFLGATAEELQTLGATIGLLGMFNYLLRPIYFLLGDIVSRLTRAT